MDRQIETRLFIGGKYLKRFEDEAHAIALANGEPNQVKDEQ